MRVADLADRRVAIWGWGREGRAALSALHRRLPGQVWTLFCSADEAAVIDAQPHLDVRGGSPSSADLSVFDVVIKSPGISAYRPEIIEAERNGSRFTSGTALWFAERPDARVIAVTGTKGKSTTAALIAHLLRGIRIRTALAGNIGMPLLELLDGEADAWVVELSSYQTRSAAAVDVAVITNVVEEHLDWHGSRERYIDDKLALAGGARQLVVDARRAAWFDRLPAATPRHGFGDPDGWHVDDGGIAFGKTLLMPASMLPLAGPHNALNLCAALTAVDAFGADARAALAHVGSFRPLPHRLTELGEHGGVRWIDDSIATTPQATLEALATLRGHDVVVLVGGHDRGLDWRGFVAAVVASPPAAIVTMGANGPRIARELHDAGIACPLRECRTLADAVAAARLLVAPGGTVLLSPGAPSFDQFRDYTERGRRFAELAGFDASSIGDIGGLGIT